MKAMVIRKFGGPDVFELADVPIPTLINGHVLVKVKASSLNPLELRIRSGMAAQYSPPFPSILNSDFSGDIVAVGDDVKQWKPGDKVLGCCGGTGDLQGALAEYILADARSIVFKPDSIDYQTAALYPLSALTAWEAIMYPGFINHGDRVLIHGASGGVGHIATQFAKIKGAIVYGSVTSYEKGEVAKQYGTDFIIVSGKQKTSDYITKYTNGSGFDAVFDTIGGIHLSESFESAKLRGTICTINARNILDLNIMQQKGLTLRVNSMLIPLFSNIGREQIGLNLDKITELIKSKQLRIEQADQVFTFSEIDRAHRYFESRQAVGKVSLINRF